MLSRSTTSSRKPRRSAAYSTRPAEFGASESSRNSLRTFRGAFDFVERGRVFQRGDVAKFFAEIRGADDAAHHFRVAGFWYVADENHVAWSERFAEITRDVVFQFGGKRSVASRVFLHYAKANQRFAFDRMRNADCSSFADL